jgi:hypothetical protein
MSKLVLLSAAVLAALTVTSLAAEFRGNPHFVDTGVSLTARKVIVGLTAGQRAAVLITADANVSAECTSPGGNSHKATADPITVAGLQVIHKRFIVDGRAKVNVTTFAPPTEIEGAPDCPSDKWTESVVDLQFTQARFSIQQPPGTEVGTLTCNLVPPTANGIVPPTQVSCAP